MAADMGRVPILDRNLSNTRRVDRRRPSPLIVLATLAVAAALGATIFVQLSVPGADRDSAQSLGDPVEHDIGVDSINSPTGPTVTGDVAVNATVTNYGTSAETDVEMNLTISERGGGEVLNESFETSVPPSGWQTFIVLGYSGTVWYRTSTTAFEGTYSAASAGGINQCSVLASGSETFHIDPGAELSFWVRRSTASSTYLYLDVWVATSAFTSVNMGSIGTVVLQLSNAPDYNNLNSTWEKKTADLSAYEGQDIYVAFNQYGGDALYLYVDQVTIGSPYTYTPVFYDTQYVTSIDPLESAYVEFDAWSALSGDYIINVSARLAGDLYTPNDYTTLTITGEVAIPEFSYALAPVIGLMLVVMAARRRIRKGPDTTR